MSLPLRKGTGHYWSVNTIYSLLLFYIKFFVWLLSNLNRVSNLFRLMIFISSVKLSINSCLYYEIGNAIYKYYTSCISLQHFNVGFQYVLQGIAA